MNNHYSFFLNEGYVFFVYNDKSICVKNSYQLDHKELAIVIEARSLIKKYDKLEHDAYELQNDDNLPLIS